MFNYACQKHCVDDHIDPVRSSGLIQYDTSVESLNKYIYIYKVIGCSTSDISNFTLSATALVKYCVRRLA